MIAIEHLEDLTDQRRSQILKRGQGQLADLIPIVDAIIAEVRARGDAALFDYTRRFDQVDLTDLAVDSASIQTATTQTDPTYRAALRAASNAIESFHTAQFAAMEASAVETTPGVRVWRVWRPIQRVGIYVPGGGARYPSTVLMTAIPARIAGCPEIIMCTPPGPDGRVAAEVLAAAEMAGVSRVYSVGGAQAIAAMAFGTRTIPKVDLLVGPGSAYVAAAKQRVAGQVAIDMPAGPSEVLIIADESARPAWVAADLLAQAEHGPTSAPVLVTTSTKIAEDVAAAIERQLATLATASVIARSLANNGALLVASNLDDAIDFANAYAPEHLELAVADPERWLPRVHHAGSVFLGSWAPEAAGDYATGGNHTLPTAGYARGFGPLSLQHFGRWMQVQSATPDGLAHLRSTIVCLAETEGLPAHAASISARFTDVDGTSPSEGTGPSGQQAGFISSPGAYEPQRVDPPVRLNANENPYAVAPQVRTAMYAAAAQVNRYPDAGQRQLRQQLSNALGCTPEMVIAGNGSDELLHLITLDRLGPGDEVIICEPTFGIYRFEASLAGATIVDVPLDADFQVDLSAVLAAVTPRTKLIWICSPNNPTGTPVDLSILPALLAAGPLIVVDEAYYLIDDPMSADASGDTTVMPLLLHQPLTYGRSPSDPTGRTVRVDDPVACARLVVVRTLSKIAGLAGLRFGYAVADPTVISRLDARRHPFNVNAIAEAAALATLSDDVGGFGQASPGGWVSQIRKALIEERTRLADTMGSWPGIKVYPSATNFLLVELPVEDASGIVRTLAARGILVRHYPQPRLRRCLRVTVGTYAENSMFLAALQTAYAEATR